APADGTDAPPGTDGNHSWAGVRDGRQPCRPSHGPGRWRGRRSAGQADGAVGGKRPVRVVRDLPRVPVGVEEDAGVPAPERRAGGAGDRRAGRLRLAEHGVDLLLRARVVREGDATPAAGVPDGAVLGERGAAPEGEDGAARLEEDDVRAGLAAATPAERLVEAARPLEIADAERDEADPLLHSRDGSSAAVLVHGAALHAAGDDDELARHVAGDRVR